MTTQALDVSSGVDRRSKPREPGAGAAEATEDFWTPGRILAAQIAALGEIDEFVEHLSPPSQNNFVVRMIPTSRDARAQYEAQSRSTEVLNKADYFLMHHCRKLVGRIDAEPATKQQLEHLVESWHDNYERQRNLLGCANAIDLAAALAPFVDLPREIADNAPRLARAFCDVPSELTEVVRLNLYLPWRFVLPVGRTLVAQAHANELLHAIERIEIAQRMRVDDPSCMPDFPTLILYFGVSTIDRPDAGTMAAIHDLVCGLMHSLRLRGGNDSVMHDCGIVTAPGVAVTQGFRLHKKYLRFLGVINDVFDATTRHALVREDGSTDFARAVRAALATQPASSSPTHQTQRNHHG